MSEQQETRTPRRAKRAPRPRKAPFNPQTPGSRLQKKRIEAGFSSCEQIASLFGIAGSTLRNWENDTREIPVHQAIRLGTALSFTLDYLYLGIEPRTGEPLPTSPIAGTAHPLLELGDIAAISAINSGMVPQRMRHESQIVVPSEEGESRFFFRVPDNAMSSNDARSINAGDAVEIDPSRPIEPGCVVLAQLDGRDSAVIRRLRVLSEAPAAFALIPLNEDYPVLHITDKQPGRLIRVVRRISPV